MLSVKDVQKIINNNKTGRVYTEHEAEAVRDFLYKLARIDAEAYRTRLSNEESSSIHSGQHRRAS